MGILLAAVVGFIVMSVLSFLPILGPIIGGAAAGFLYKKGMSNGAKAGFLAGIIGSLFLAIIFTIGVGLSGALSGIPVIGAIVGGGLGSLLVLLTLYQGFLGLVGGAIVGSIKS